MHSQSQRDGNTENYLNQKVGFDLIEYQKQGDAKLV